MSKLVTLPFEYGFPLFVPAHSMPNLIKLPKTMVSDIWSFWDYLIKTYCIKKGKISGNFLPSLLEQAKYFYEAAENAPLKSQPLLFYYSFLNLAKIVINLNYPVGNSAEYYHGIETKVNNSTTIESATVNVKMYGGLASSKISVAKEFLNIMGESMVVPQLFFIKNLLSSCIGIHRTYCETFNQKESFYRLENNSTITRDGKLIFFESEVQCQNDLNMNNLITAGYNISKRNCEGKIIYIYREELNMKNYNVSLDCWSQLSNLIKNHGIWSYTDGNEYRLYISKESMKLSSASVIYCLMFFLGSITRYHPYFFESILNAKEQWLISEFLKTQPMQFLYLVTSQMVGNYIYKSRTGNL